MTSSQSKGRTTAMAVALACGIAVFAAVLNRHYPIERWLVWTYAALWAYALVWALACLTSGHFLLTRVLRARLPWRESLLLGFATGVLAFGLGIFLIGLAGGLGGVTFFLWPAVLVAIGARSTFGYLKTRVRRTRTVGARRRKHPSLFDRARLVFGAVGVAVLYLQCMTPANIGYDARWYHLGLAEGYAVTGQIYRMADGFFNGALPQLATWLYTWAFTVPGTDLFFRIELCAHIELVLFLATLAGIPLLVRHLVGGGAWRGAWVALFLFPGIFVFDSNLIAGADHALAFWAVPIALAVRRVLEAPGRSTGLVLGLMTAGAVCTKYSFTYFVAGAACLVAIGLVRRMLHAREAGPATSGAHAAALGLAAATAIALTTPHWLKNWIWYGNPVYPSLHHLFGGSPWSPSTVISTLEPGYSPEGSLLARLLESVGSLFTFSFVPHSYHEIPEFGSLFTLLLLPLVFVRGAARTWSLSVATLCGVIVWYWTYHQDRYLQALLPWMAAVTAAAIILLWRTRSVSVRAALSTLVAVQIVWGGDFPVLPVRRFPQVSPIHESLDLLTAGFQGEFEKRRETFSRLPDVAASLPADAVVLLHDEHLRLGLDRRVITDSYGRQGAISYRDLVSAEAVYRMLHGMGVTHVVASGVTLDSYPISDDLIFHDFVRGLRVEATQPYVVLPLNPPPTPSREGVRTTLVGCHGLMLADTVDAIDEAWIAMRDASCAPPAINDATLRASLDSSRFALVDRRVFDAGARLPSGWKELFTRDPIVAYVRP